MGRLTMFEDLFDHDPPVPGLHEFARVTERARDLRRRRARSAVWATLAVGLVLCGAAVWSLTRTSPSTVTPADLIDGIDRIDRPATTVPQAATTTVPGLPRYPLGDVGTAGGLPPVALDRPVEAFATAGTTVEITGGDHGAICATVGPGGSQTPTCSDGSTGLLVASRSGSARATTAIVVDPTVDVAFVAVGAECVPAATTGEPVDAAARVWVCTGLDVARAYADIVGPRYVLIGVPARDP